MADTTSGLAQQAQKKQNCTNGLWAVHNAGSDLSSCIPGLPMDVRRQAHQMVAIRQSPEPKKLCKAWLQHPQLCKSTSMYRHARSLHRCLKQTTRVTSASCDCIKIVKLPHMIAGSFSALKSKRARTEIEKVRVGTPAERDKERSSKCDNLVPFNPGSRGLPMCSLLLSTWMLRSNSAHIQTQPTDTRAQRISTACGFACITFGVRSHHCRKDVPS